MCLRSNRIEEEGIRITLVNPHVERMSLVYRHFHVLEVVALAVLLLSSTAAAAESAEVLAKKLVAASHAQDYNAVVKLIAAGLYPPVSLLLTPVAKPIKHMLHKAWHIRAWI